MREYGVTGRRGRGRGKKEGVTVCFGASRVSCPFIIVIIIIIMFIYLFIYLFNLDSFSCEAQL